jgi:hypothetical protein
MAGEKCGLFAVPRTVPVSLDVTRTLRMFVLQSTAWSRAFMLQLRSQQLSLTVNFEAL